MKLLILDDDTQIREGLKKGIDWKSLGFEEVKSAGDGISGLEILREFMPDIVLSDVRMPGMDGLEFLRQARALLPGIKVALISGYDDFEYLQKAIRYGADGYELKPIKMIKLFRLIEELKAKIEEDRRRKADDTTAEAPPKKALSLDALLGGKLREMEGMEKDIPLGGRIRRAADYVYDNLALELSTRSLGDLLQISPNYFSSIFRQETGMAFNSFVNRSRMRAAAYLLEHTDQRIAEVAAHTGFQEAVYFSQAFKKEYGRSPRDYRQALEKESGMGDHDEKQ